MAGHDAGNRPARGAFRFLTAIALALLLAVLFWAATPYNNFLVTNSFVSESYLPLTVLAAVLGLVLMLNPLLALAGRRRMLDSRQLALIFGLLLVASGPASTGLMRYLPYGLVQESNLAAGMKADFEAYRTSGLRMALFPGPMLFQQEAPQAKYFLSQLPEGMAIPWEAWSGPLLAWGVALLAAWLMLMGLAGIVYPQWRDNEKLAFPLLAVQKALIGPAAPGRSLPPLFYSRPFWLALAAVFLVYLLKGLNLYYPRNFPAIPLRWYIAYLFNEPPLSALPWYIWSGQIYFVFIGAAFFMSSRVSLSIWAFQLLYAVWTVLTRCYAPSTFNWGMPADHRTGAMLVMTGGILYLGRAHWRHVIGCVFRKARSDSDRDNRFAAFLFLGGCGLLYAWLLWAGAQPLWSLCIVAGFFVYALLVTRLVAETGLVLIGFVPDHFLFFLRMLPIGWLKPATIWLWAAMSGLASVTSQGSPAVLATHALGLNDQPGVRRRSPLLALCVAVLMLSVVVAGAAHLAMNYRHSISLDGKVQPLNPDGYLFFDPGREMLKEKAAGDWKNLPDYNRPAHIAFGAVLTGALQYACMKFPNWPLHPVGMLLVFGFFAETMWISVFLGWFLKSLIVFIGGARSYTGARPFFIGLIVGEVLSALFWAIVALIVLWLGHEYKVVKVLPW